MKKWVATVKNFLVSEDGPTAVEYAVMLALIIVVCIAAISTLGSNASNTFNYVCINAATTSSRATPGARPAHRDKKADGPTRQAREQRVGATETAGQCGSASDRG